MNDIMFEERRYTTDIDPVTGKFGLVPVKQMKNGLEVGQRVIGEYGMCFSERGIFYVYNEPDEHGNQILVEEGRPHRLHDVNAVQWGCKPISKKFGIGTYWDDSEDGKTYRMPREELDELYRQCMVQRAWNERCERVAKEADERRDAEQTAEWERKYGRLMKPIKAANTWCKEYRQQRRHNVLALIKHCMPGFKFSLTKRDYCWAYELEWTDGPTEDEVREMIPFHIFKTCWGETRMDDYYDQHAIRNSFAMKYGDCEEGIRLRRNYSDPDGWDKFRDVSFYEKPAAKPEHKDYESTQSKGIAMLDTEDGFCLMGRKTYYIRKEIKALGGKWNKEQQAWCFVGNESREEVMELLNK